MPIFNHGPQKGTVGTNGLKTKEQHSGFSTDEGFSSTYMSRTDVSVRVDDRSANMFVAVSNNVVTAAYDVDGFDVQRRAAQVGNVRTSVGRCCRVRSVVTAIGELFVTNSARGQPAGL